MFKLPLRYVVLLLALLMVMLSGCSQKPSSLHYDSMGASDQVVWPAPPEIPRYRFVGQLTGDENFLSDENNKPFFAVRAFRWLVGLVAGKEIPQGLQRPQTGMVGADGRIYVTDVSRQAVAVFDIEAGEFVFWEDASPNMRFLSPIAIAEGANNEILVTDSKWAMVVRLDSKGTPLGSFGSDVLKQPTGIARDAESGVIYVADTHGHDIKVFSDQGELLRSFGIKGEAQGQFNSPTHMAFRDGVLYVADTMNARVQMFDRDDKPIRTFGRRGLFVGNMPRPKGVTIDNNGLIYVVESYHDYLLIFNDQGEFLMPIGGTGHGVGQFYLPAGVWSDNNNKVYVADMFNGRVVVFEFLGEMGHES